MPPGAISDGPGSSGKVGSFPRPRLNKPCPRPVEATVTGKEGFPALVSAPRRSPLSISLIDSRKPLSYPGLLSAQLGEELDCIFIASSLSFLLPSGFLPQRGTFPPFILKAMVCLISCFLQFKAAGLFPIIKTGGGKTLSPSFRSRQQIKGSYFPPESHQISPG